LKEIKERFHKLREPVEEYDNQGRLIKEYHPHSPYGELMIEVIYTD